MRKKFDAEAYVAKWDARVVPAMIGTIIVSFILAVILNILTRPECLRHEYIFCGAEAVHHAEEEGVTEGDNRASPGQPH